VRVYQNANYGRPPPIGGIVFPTSRCKLPPRLPEERSARARARARSLAIVLTQRARARTSIHRALPFPPALLEKPFVSALRFYGSMVLSSEFRQQRSAPPCTTLSLCLSLSVSHPPRIRLRLPSTLSPISLRPRRCRTRHYVTIVP